MATPFRRPATVDQSAAVPPPASAVPTTTPEVHSALAALDAERAGHREALELFPERERGLLDREAPDEDFAALDVQRKRIRYKLDKLDKREGQLLDALQMAELADAQAAWLALADEYEPVARDIAKLGRAFNARLIELQALSGRSHSLARAWHVREALPGFDYLPALSTQALDYPVQAARAARDVRLTVPSPAVRLYTVRFLTFWDGGSRMAGPAYSTGMEAGFVAAIAWYLVENRIAEWLDLTRVPADPRPKPPAAATVTEGRR